MALWYHFANTLVECCTREAFVRVIVDADTQLTHMLTQGCPSPYWHNSTTGKGSREVRLGQRYIVKWVNFAPALTCLIIYRGVAYACT